MLLFERKDLVKYVAEIFVVVFGILIAFQVEEWRERLAEERDLQAALVRLKEETTANLEICETQMPSLMRVADATHVVLGSLLSNRLADEDVEQFDRGLIMLGWNPRPPFVSTVAEEMISTGLLKELEDEALRAEIAKLPGRIRAVTGDMAARGANLQAAFDELSRSVELDYSGPTNLEELGGEFPQFEQGIIVKYDFQSLSGNTYLKNLLVEVTDTHTDRYGSNRSLCEILAEIDVLLAETASL